MSLNISMRVYYFTFYYILQTIILFIYYILLIQASSKLQKKKKNKNRAYGIDSVLERIIFFFCRHFMKREKLILGK